MAAPPPRFRFKSVQQELACIVVTYIKRSNYMAKAAHLDTLSKEGKTRDQRAMLTNGAVFCEFCCLPRTTGSLKGPAINCCKYCSRILNCDSPYCQPFKQTVELECVQCAKKRFCSNCIGNCVFCFKVCCKKCALVSKATMTICSEACAQQTAKRAKLNE